ncbi:MAG: glycosyltransferase family 4 protein [Planctomycetota bacterium]
MINSNASVLCYYANVRFPSERANSIQIVNMCSAFSECGVDVTLHHPIRYNRFRAAAPSLFAFYNVPERFGTKRLFSVDFIDFLPRSLQHPAFRLQSFSFGLRALPVMLRSPGAFHYIRDNATLFLATCLLPRRVTENLFYEAHDFPEKPRSAAMLIQAVRRCGGVVAITHGLKERFLSAGLAPKRLHVAPDGVNLERFENMPDREAARKSLSLPVGEPVAVYTGQFFPWKGVETLVGAAPYLEHPWTLVLVGGQEQDRIRLEKLAQGRNVRSRVIFRERVKPGDIPVWLSAADLLVLPNSGRFAISSHYTSPMKLFEYMASKRPIVASDLPSLREVLRHEENALLVPPDDSQALAKAMDRLLTDRELNDTLSCHAAQEVSRFSWIERARGILGFMQAEVCDTRLDQGVS